MKNSLLVIQPRELVKWSGTIGGGRYLAVGSSLLLLKIYTDSLISHLVFHRPWQLIDYLFPASALSVSAWDGTNVAYYATLLICSLPYAWLGSVYTVRRLRALGLPLWMVALFYVPIINLFLFALLCVMCRKGEPQGAAVVLSDEQGHLPSHERVPDEQMQLPLAEQVAAEQSRFAPEPVAGGYFPAEGAQIDQQAHLPVVESATARKDDPLELVPSEPAIVSNLHDMHASKRRDLYQSEMARSRRESLAPAWAYAIVPEDSFLGFVVSALLPVPLALLLCYAGTSVLGAYGLGLFVAVPFCVSLFSSLLFMTRQWRSYGSLLAVSVSSLSVIGLALILLRMEGAVCLVMLIPAAFAIAAFGAAMAYGMQAGRSSDDLPMALCVGAIFTPAIMLMEYLAGGNPPIYEVASRLEVDAPPAVVWQHVVSFPPLPAPGDLLFRAGIAYPVHATISGNGKGALRRCVFSTGTFTEPITVWDCPRLLRFNVTEQALPMKELSPMGEIDAPHLHGYMISKQGQFKLIPLANNKTLLEGTTWYQHGLYPSGYWRIWSDAIIHKIHMRVLSHVKTLSEARSVSAL